MQMINTTMAQPQSSGTLSGWYQRRIGEPTTRDEVTGYWLFVAGLLVGIIGIILFFLTAEQTVARGIAYALVALAPPFLMLGSVIRFPLRKAGTYLGYLGFLASVAAVVWFVSIFPGGWLTATGNTGVIALYGAGIFLTGIAGTIVPLLSVPIRVEPERRTEEPAVRDEKTAARDEEAAAREEELETAHERTEALESRVDTLQAEIDAYRQSQARFELFEDRGGQFRWRLRHRNGNVIADSGEGYTRRHNARKGMHSVKRNALGAGVMKVEATAETEADPEPDDAADPVVAVPTEDEAVDVRASFELYEDQAGESRWRLRHDNGNILADSSEGYASESGAKHSLERIRAYVGPADYLWFDPAGFEIYQDRGGEFRWRLVHRNGNVLADGGEGYTRRHDASRAVDRIRERADELDFDVYEDQAGEYRWRLRGGNDQILAAVGEGYDSREGAETAVERVRELAPRADVLDVGQAAFEIYEDQAGEHRWRLRHRNGNILSDSGEGYTDRSSARDAVEGVKRHAPNATVERVE